MIDPSRFDRLGVLGVRRRKVARPRQDARQHAANIFGQMQRHEHGRRQAGRQALDHALQRTDAPGGGTDDDHVELRHAALC
jgi:hypothetical protein